MPRCNHCGNDYDRTFEIHQGGKVWVFDSFECAIEVVAPRCAHCDVRVIGHGVQKDDTIFCCVHCAEAEGVRELRDRA